MSKRQPKSSSNTPFPQATSAWEWMFAVLGAVLVLSTVGYLIYFEATTPSRPPQVKIESATAQPAGGKYLVRFTARNLSGATAGKAVTVKPPLV